MKILYGVSGEGLGHSSRAKEIILHLRKKGHKVLIMTYGQAYPVLKSLAETIKIEGIHLHFEGDSLSLKKTINHGTKNMLTNLKNLNSIKKEINRFKPDLCITDYEPIVPIMRYWYKLPLISIDNQHRLTHVSLKIPPKYRKDFLLAKHATNLCVSRADAFIILSFAKARSLKKNVYIVSPILRKEIQKIKTTKSDNILVYQTKPNQKLIEILEKIPEKFIVYGYNTQKHEGNLHFKKTSKDFLKDLASCKAVISTAGFTLISEANYLKKPFFALPLKGQFEQTLNALFLKKANYGNYSDSPNEQQIRKFLSSIPFYEKNLQKHKTNPREAFKVIDKVLSKLQYSKKILNNKVKLPTPRGLPFGQILASLGVGHLTTLQNRTA